MAKTEEKLKKKRKNVRQNDFRLNPFRFFNINLKVLILAT